MVDITSISAVVAAIGVIVGVVFTVLELRNLVKTRQTDLVIRLYSTFGSKEFQEVLMKVLDLEFKDYNGFVKKYVPSTSEENPIVTATSMVGIFFEGIGLLLHRKLIDIGLVGDLFISPVTMAWEKMKPIAEGWRKQYNRPEIFEWFEYLDNEMKKREQLAKIQ